MRDQWKRNAVVATVLLFVCAAVYLNWRYAGNVANDAAPASQNQQDQQSGETDGQKGNTTKVLGDAALVGGVPTLMDDAMTAAEGSASANSYFDTARLSRQQSRDNALSLLREASAQENADQGVLDDANRAIQTLAGYAMLEGQAVSYTHLTLPTKRLV